MCFFSLLGVLLHAREFLCQLEVMIVNIFNVLIWRHTLESTETEDCGSVLFARKILFASFHCQVWNTGLVKGCSKNLDLKFFEI